MIFLRLHKLFGSDDRLGAFPNRILKDWHDDARIRPEAVETLNRVTSLRWTENPRTGASS
ncbi:hypothetical protein CKO25_14135 [Thiocapsa imhoffii]|uniref:Uncharacterized protein n=1 Tax=Thiocapsa imhoffii TaxID=382777 RepID=A0A9X1BA60_9GAMM|nr:hypothetical protein [Thiocapsa imhoffii]